MILPSRDLPGWHAAAIRAFSFAGGQPDSAPTFQVEYNALTLTLSRSAGEGTPTAASLDADWETSSVDEYVELMDGLDLPRPRMMDVAVPANLRLGMRP